MNASALPSTAQVLLDRIIYKTADLIIQTGTKAGDFAFYRAELLAPMRPDNDDTATRLLKILAAHGDIIRLPQDKDFDNQKFGPVRLAPTQRIWSRIRAKVDELKARYRRHAKKAKKAKKASKNRPTFLQTISSLSEEKKGRREKEQKRQRMKAQEDREIARLDLAAQNNGQMNKTPASTALGRLLKKVVCRE